ncbi:IS4 family transposase [Nocardia sp. NPDC058658]|uniref:IS4 family transposase n=1 Tax=Nocardia sp. NPDC058658 TaxID=3346580 RepID=UPI00365D65D0
MFAPGHLGELTQIVPFEMVDAALESGRAVQTRVRDLPSRVVVYLLLAGALFAEIGYTGVWAKLVAGLEGLSVASPDSSALSQARRRIGAAPLRELFALLKGPAAGALRWRGMLVCAVDGTSVYVAASPANLAAYRRHSAGPNGDSGYPMMRLVAIVACGTRTVLDAVFGPDSSGETTYAPQLFTCLGPRTLLLADRNFDAAKIIESAAANGAQLLIRGKLTRKMAILARLPDGSWLTRLGTVELRIIDADILITSTRDGAVTRRVEHYQFLTTLTDHRRYRADDLVELYHQRWEIETSYLELKSSILGGRVLRARYPELVNQEIYALLITYQVLRTAIADTALASPAISPDRASFTIALNTARDQVILAAGVIADTVVDLVGTIGRAVLAAPLPSRRARACPRIVKRAISKHRAKGNIDRNAYRIQVTIEILGDG